MPNQFQQNTIVIEDYKLFFLTDPIREHKLIQLGNFFKNLISPYTNEYSDLDQVISLSPINTHFIDSLKDMKAKKGVIYLADSIPPEIAQYLRQHFNFLENTPAVKENYQTDFLHQKISVRPKLRDWIKALRCYQYVKNVLIFVPLIAAHEIFNPQLLSLSLQAFISMSMAASSIYLLNDLFDTHADRQHPTKKNRPIASGIIPASQALTALCLLVLGSLLLSATISLHLLLFTLLYLGINILYTLVLKKIPIFDILILAGLYSFRIIYGSVATQIMPSFWLLGLSLFLFLSLALVKRYTEIAQKSSPTEERREKPKKYIRGYTSSDLPILLSIGINSGIISVLVFALFINNPDISRLYKNPMYLWGICPLYLMWIMKIWMVTIRGHMTDDPIIFSFKNRTSIILLFLVGFLSIMAT